MSVLKHLWATIWIWAMASVCAGQATGNVFKLLRCTDLPEYKQMHGAAVVGDRLYVMGGEGPNGWSLDTFSAGIAADGSLSSWRKEAQLPQYRAYISTSVEVINDHIYLVGGTTSKEQAAIDGKQTLCRDVIWTKVKSDGTLEPWRLSEQWPGVSISCVSSASAEGHLYIVGGLAKGQKVLNEILMCDIGPDGSPTNWRQDRALPSPLWFHGVRILGDRMYVWGGLDTFKSDSVNEKVFSAQIGSDGRIGEWRTEPSVMSEPIYSAAFSGFNDFLVTVGGRYKNAYPTNVIWYSRLENGIPGAWNFMKTDLQATIYTASGIDTSRGVVYVTGGQPRKGPRVPDGTPTILPVVQAFRVSQPRGSVLPDQQASGGQGSTNSLLDTFMDLDSAIKKGAAEKKPVLVYFYSPQVPACLRVLNSILATEQFRKLASSYIVAKVDITHNSNAAYKYAVFKVPSLAVVKPDGSVGQKLTRINTIEDLAPLNQP